MSPDEATAHTPSTWTHPVLGRLLDRLRAAPPRRLPPLPPAGSAPAEHRKFWAELAAHLRPELIAAHPLAVGAMDGLPAAARHAANVSLLGPAVAHWSAVKAELRVRVDAARVAALSRDRVRLWQAQRKLDDVAAIRRILDEFPGARLLMLDLHSGSRGMAAMAFGDTDAARHIGVTIPGMNTNIADSFWGMAEEARRLKALAESLLARAEVRDEPVATVMWLGYEPPQVTGPNGPIDTVAGSVAAALTSAANAGAPRLAGFLSGLDVAARPRLHMSVLGHSYGSYATALALQLLARRDPNPGNPVDDAVFYGSPGINASSEQELGLAPGHGYVMLGDRDRINLVDNFKLFGPDPTTTSLIRLSTAAMTTPDGVERHAARDHADYGRAVGEDLRTSGFNLAAIIAGLGELAVRQ